MRFHRTSTAYAILCDPDLGHAAARVGSILALMARPSGPDRGWAWPSQASLAAWLGASPATVERAVRDLEAAGWIERRRTRMGNSYRVLEPHEPADEAWLDVVLPGVSER